MAGRTSEAQGAVTEVPRAQRTVKAGEVVTGDLRSRQTSKAGEAEDDQWLHRAGEQLKDAWKELCTCS